MFERFKRKTVDQDEELELPRIRPEEPISDGMRKKRKAVETDTGISIEPTLSEINTIIVDPRLHVDVHEIDRVTHAAKVEEEKDFDAVRSEKEVEEIEKFEQIHESIADGNGGREVQVEKGDEKQVKKVRWWRRSKKDKSESETKIRNRRNKTLSELFFGKKKYIIMEYYDPKCPDCTNGYTSTIPCKECEGKGTDADGFFCKWCDGTGKRDDYQAVCQTCGGSGVKADAIQCKYCQFFVSMAEKKCTICKHKL